MPHGLPFVGEEGTDGFGYPKTFPDSAALLQLLRAKRFDELSKDFEAYQAAFEEDWHKEYWPLGAANSFASPDPAIGPLLEAWMEHDPQSFAPHLAYGVHQVGVAWYFRGNEYASRTSNARFRLFREHTQIADRSFRRALALRPRLIVAQRKLVAIMDARKRTEFLEASLRTCPECYTVRETHLRRLAPEWGGSHEQMAAFAEAAQEWATKNPRLRVLKGFVDFHKTRELRLAGKHLEAVALLTTALRHGGQPDFYQLRGHSLVKLGELERAISDYTAGLALEPQSTELLIGRYFAYSQRQDYLAAANDLLRARQVDVMEGDASVEWVTNALLRAAREAAGKGNPAASRPLIEALLELDPDNAAGQAMRAALK